MVYIYKKKPPPYNFKVDSIEPQKLTPNKKLQSWVRCLFPYSEISFYLQSFITQLYRYFCNLVITNEFGLSYALCIKMSLTMFAATKYVTLANFFKPLSSVETYRGHTL